MGGGSIVKANAGTAYVASVEFDGTTTEYKTIDAAWTAAQGKSTDATKRATVTLLTDVEIEWGYYDEDLWEYESSSLVVKDNDYITLDLNGCVLNGSKANDSVITVKSSGDFVLKDSNPSKTNTITIDGKAFNGGVITGGNGGNGGAVYNTGTFTMQGGTLAGNNASTNGGAVYNSGTLTMNGGTITGNTSDNGGGVWNGGSGKFTMTGGTISGNYAYNGGGVSNENTFTMTGGTISGNTAGTEGGGVNNYFIFNLSGDATITNNKHGTGDTAVDDNIYLNTDKVIALSDGTNAAAFTGTAGVTMQTTGVFTSGWNTSGSFDYASRFTSDDDDYIINAAVGELELIKPQAEVYFDDDKDAVTKGTLTSVWVTARTSTEAKPATVKLLADVDLTSALSVAGGDYITLDLNGFVLDRNLSSASSTGYVIYNEGNLTIEDSDSTKTDTITIDGKTFNGGVITGASVSGSGGGIQNYRTLTMTGGTIAGNAATSYGGGVYNVGSANFTMTGGTITGNTAIKNGGGVFVNGTFNLSGGANITNNTKGTGETATDNNVHLATDKVINISDGTSSTAFTGTAGVTMETAGDFTSGWTGADNTTTPCFTSDSKFFKVAENGDELKLIEGDTYTVSGNITNMTGPITVKLIQKGAVAKTSGGDASVDTTSGAYSISGVMNGLYSITVFDGTTTYTEQVIVKGADVVKDMNVAVNSGYNINTEIQSAELNVTADNLDDMFVGTPTADTTIKLVVEDITDTIDSLTPEIVADKVLIDEKANGKTFVSYLNIKLLKDGGGIQPNGKLNVTIALPESVLADEGFTVIYAHDGKAKIIAPDYKAELHAISFSLTELSTYSIVYGKIAVSSGGSSIKKLDVDNDAPTIEKVGDNIVVEDKHLAKVTLNGKEIEFSDNKAVINTKELENGEYTVYAVDKFRREATSTFTVENETATTPEPVTPVTPPTPTEEGTPFPWWIIVLVVVLGAGAFIGYKKFKK